MALVIAGGLSYFASPDPDGLDSVTLHGCDRRGDDGGEQLDGTCIAQNATEQRTRPAARSPTTPSAAREGTNGARRGRSACS